MSKKPSYSHDETITLLELFTQHHHMLLSSFKSTVTNNKKQQLWQEIKNEVNRVGGHNRDVDQIKHKWKDLKQHAKKDLSARKRPQTGGGKPPKEGVYTDIVLDIIGLDAPSVTGITGATESGIAKEDPIESQKTQLLQASQSATIDDTAVTEEAANTSFIEGEDTPSASDLCE